jgi:hypothetical protein
MNFARILLRQPTNVKHLTKLTMSLSPTLAINCNKRFQKILISPVKYNWNINNQDRIMNFTQCRYFSNRIQNKNIDTHYNKKKYNNNSIFDN